MEAFMQKHLMAFTACLTVLLASGAVDAQPIPGAVASSDRPKADVDRDGLRKPSELLAFSQIKPGDSVADIMPGQGYYTRLFSKLVGPSGHVYAIVPSELAAVAPKAVDASKSLAAEPGFGNVSAVVAPTETLMPGGGLDAAWTSDNYHDLYGFFGPEKAASFDKAVFDALKPGGVFVVIDHVADRGGDAASIKHLHRIDPAVVKAQVLAAGFQLEAESAVLANPGDKHEKSVFDPDVRGHTDQFAFRFRKPH
jgi:predicted methyltransferase